MKSILTLLALAFIFVSCNTSPADKAANSINKDSLLRHIETLSSDAYMGRGTGTEGEQMTVDIS